LEVTRVTRGKVTLDMRTCDLSKSILAPREAFVEPARQKGIALQFAEPDRPFFVSADANRVQQILRNVHAVKFAPAGGGVTLTLRVEAGSALVTIRDTGEGIATEFLPFVFELFRQREQGTRRTHDGLGIGLALVKRLTELQAGKVSIASDGAGRGTAVTIQFPLVEAPAHLVPTTAPVTGLLHELRGLRILVVDDVDDARATTRVILEYFGADVLEASDGVEALEMVKRGDPDVVLGDLRMPHMDGFELIRTLHLDSGGRCLPVIAVSALAGSAAHLRTQAAGFEGYLDKPFDDVGLLAAIGVVIARRS
jgi:CheY-like chemotaxis protein/anti-sigma regulatory factor (Ser/Thr protein kinase)